MRVMRAAAAAQQRAVRVRTRTAAPAARAVMASRATSMSATTASRVTVKPPLRRAARCSTRLAMSARTAISRKLNAAAVVNAARLRSTAMLCGLLVRRVTARKVIVRAATGLRVIVRMGIARAPTVRKAIARAVTGPRVTVRKARAVKAVVVATALAEAKVYPGSCGAEKFAPRDLHHGELRAARLVRRQWITSNHHRLTNPGPA